MRTEIKADKGRHQNHQCDARLRKLKEIQGSPVTTGQNQIERFRAERHVEVCSERNSRLQAAWEGSSSRKDLNVRIKLVTSMSAPVTT